MLLFDVALSLATVFSDHKQKRQLLHFYSRMGDGRLSENDGMPSGFSTGVLFFYLNWD